VKLATESSFVFGKSRLLFSARRPVILTEVPFGFPVPQGQISQKTMVRVPSPVATGNLFCHRTQDDTGARPAFNPIDTGGSYRRNKAAAA